MRLSEAVGRHCTAGVALLVVLTGCAATPPESYSPDFGRPDIQRVAGELLTLAGFLDDPIPSDEIRLRVMPSMDLNAANTGDNVFYFTEGLLQTDDSFLQRAVVAHELAHEDLGHREDEMAASVLMTAAFTAAGMFVPGLGYADTLTRPMLSSAFSRSQEVDADLHAVTILERANRAAGLGPEAARQEAVATMTYALSVLRDQYGGRSGGLLSSHPGLDDRLAEMQALAPDQAR